MLCMCAGTRGFISVATGSQTRRIGQYWLEGVCGGPKQGSASGQVVRWLTEENEQEILEKDLKNNWVS